jgi:hypothetical protein
MSQSYDRSLVFVSGTVTPQSGTDVLHGSDKVELAPPVTMPNFVTTHSGTVRWTFHKLP